MVDAPLTLIFRMGQGVCHFLFEYKGSLYRIYERLHLIAAQITQGARPKIIDSPLTLIFRMGQGLVLTWFCL
jgi:hypothetical protein